MNDVCLEATAEIEEACSMAKKYTKAESVKQANAPSTANTNSGDCDEEAG